MIVVFPPGSPTSSFSPLAPEILDEIVFHLAARLPERLALTPELCSLPLTQPYKDLVSFSRVNKACNASANPQLYRVVVVHTVRGFPRNHRHSSLYELFVAARSRPRLFESVEIFELDASNSFYDEKDLKGTLRVLNLMPNLRRVRLLPSMLASTLLASLHPSSRVLAIGTLIPEDDGSLRLRGKETLDALQELEMEILEAQRSDNVNPPPPLPPVKLRLPTSLTSFKLTPEYGTGPDVKLHVIGHYPNLRKVTLIGSGLVASNLEPLFLKAPSVEHLTLLETDLTDALNSYHPRGDDDRIDFRDPDVREEYLLRFDDLLPDVLSSCSHLVTLTILDVHLPQVLALSHPTLQGIILQFDNTLALIQRIARHHDDEHPRRPPVRTNRLSRLVAALEELADEHDDEEEEEEEKVVKKRFPLLSYLEIGGLWKWPSLLWDESDADALWKLTVMLEYLGLELRGDYGEVWSKEVMGVVLKGWEDAVVRKEGEKKSE